jgi:hypothetical protein
LDPNIRTGDLLTFVATPDCRFVCVSPYEDWPIGTIIIWNNLELVDRLSDFLARGWAVADGSLGTVSLEAKFPLGWGDDDNFDLNGGSSRPRFGTGGTQTHTHAPHSAIHFHCGEGDNCHTSATALAIDAIFNPIPEFISTTTNTTGIHVHDPASGSVAHQNHIHTLDIFDVFQQSQLFTSLVAGLIRFPSRCPDQQVKLSIENFTSFVPPLGGVCNPLTFTHVILEPTNLPPLGLGHHHLLAVNDLVGKFGISPSSHDHRAYAASGGGQLTHGSKYHIPAYLAVLFLERVD